MSKESDDQEKTETKPDGQSVDMMCPACRYVGPPIKMKIPPLAREIDSRGNYCPLCVQTWYYRNIAKMRPLP